MCAKLAISHETTNGNTKFLDFEQRSTSFSPFYFAMSENSCTFVAANEQILIYKTLTQQ